MSQQFLVLKCFACSMFQVHQVKKSKTWTCKLCNEKQSLRKIYAQGTGKECRMQVQMLNMRKSECENEVCVFKDTSQCTVANVEESKWTRFITSSLKLENDSDDDSEMKLSEVRNISAVTLDRDEWLGNKKRRVQKRRNEREDQTSANVFQRKRKNIFSASENVLGRIGISKSYPDFMKQPKIYESLTQPVDNVKTTEEDKGNTASSTSGNSVLCEDKKLPEEDRHISKWDRFRSDEHGSSEEEDDHESLVFT